jgi:hypothetical protein
MCRSLESRRFQGGESVFISGGKQLKTARRHPPDTFPSWPGLSRPSTSFLLDGNKDVDARHKAGHDELTESAQFYWPLFESDSEDQK